jgi:hypothetical protein
MPGQWAATLDGTPISPHVRAVDEPDEPRPKPPDWQRLVRQSRVSEQRLPSCVDADGQWWIHCACEVVRLDRIEVLDRGKVVLDEQQHDAAGRMPSTAMP